MRSRHAQLWQELLPRVTCFARPFLNVRRKPAAHTDAMPSYSDILNDDPVLPRMLYPGAIVNGCYTIEAEIGQGGIATVYRVHDEPSGQKYALKCLHPDKAGQPVYDDMLQREADLQQRCIHPHIVTLEDVVKAEDGRLALIFPLLRGGTLAERMAKNNGLNSRKRKLLRALLASALDTMAAHSIAHLDISPENIMFMDESYRSVKLIDFSLARDCSRNETHDFYSTTFAGKERWAAPEVLHGGKITPACDRYSLHKILTSSF